MATVLGGPISGTAYWLSLVLDAGWLYLLLMGGMSAAALFLVALSRRAARSSITSWGPTPTLAPRLRFASRCARAEGSASTPRSLFIVVSLVMAVYYFTTGVLFSQDARGNLLLDPALQRDTLFHVGLVRALESSYPPELLSVAGVRARYHLGYDLQLAAWSRFFGIDPLDGVYRVGPLWSLGLLVLSAFGLGLRFHDAPRRAVASSALLFGSGLGFLFFKAPGADWWSLVFLDAAVVSLFLTNPLLPALPLLFVGLSSMDDYLRTGRGGSLLGSAVSIATVLTVKVFLGAQILLALALAALFVRGEARSRFRRAAAAIGLAATPFVLELALAAGTSNTGVSARPLEIVRYSTEKLGWERGAAVLADVGAGGASASGLAAGVTLTLFWLAGFLGLRVLALSGLARDLSGRQGSVRHLLATFVVVGFPLSLVLRIAPAEATGLSRSEAINDVLWFATQSGLLLWFWTTDALARLPTAAVPVFALLAFPSTVQHFVHHASLAPDVLPSSVLEAAAAARALSRPGDFWVDPPDRVRASPIAYLAGRPVVYDPYVGYDYMFVPRRELEERRHGVQHFWRSEDPGYVAWFLSRYEVGWVYATEDFPPPAAASAWTDQVAPSIYRVHRILLAPPIRTPETIPLGALGAAFFGEGWGPPEGTPRRRALRPGTAVLWIPSNGGTELRLRVEGEEVLEIVVPAQATRPGLNRIEVPWRGAAPLAVERIQIGYNR